MTAASPSQGARRAARAEPNEADPARLASDLRGVLGQLVRRLRAEHRFSLSHGSVLGRLDRAGPQSVSQLAASERIRPQSMAQTVGELESAGLVTREPDPTDGRRALVDLTTEGRLVLAADRRQREGWLARGIEESFSKRELKILTEALELLRRLAEG